MANIKIGSIRFLVILISYLLIKKGVSQRMAPLPFSLGTLFLTVARA